MEPRKFPATKVSCYTVQKYKKFIKLIYSCNSNQAWGKHLGQMLEELHQVLVKCLSTNTSLYASIKQMLPAQNKAF